MRCASAPACWARAARSALVHRARGHHGSPWRRPGCGTRRHRPSPRRSRAAGHRPIPAGGASYGGRSRRLGSPPWRRSTPRTACASSSPLVACAMAKQAPHPVGRIAAVLRCAISISTCRQPKARRASRSGPGVDRAGPRPAGGAVTRTRAATAARRDRGPARRRAAGGAVRGGGGTQRAVLDDGAPMPNSSPRSPVARRSCASPTARSRRPDPLRKQDS